MDTITVRVICTAALLAVFAYYVWQRVVATDCGDEECTVGCASRRRLSVFMMLVTLAALVLLLSACKTPRKTARRIDPHAECVSIHTGWYCVVRGQGMLCDDDLCLPLKATPLPEAPP